MLISRERGAGLAPGARSDLDADENVEVSIFFLWRRSFSVFSFIGSVRGAALAAPGTAYLGSTSR